MGKRCLLVIQNNSLLRQAISSLLVKEDDLELIEGRASNFPELLDEVVLINPDIILLDDSFPYSGDSSLMQLLVIKPNLPVVVVSKEENLVHVVHRETYQLDSPSDLANTINLI